MKNRRKQGKIFRSLLAVLMLTAMLVTSVLQPVFAGDYEAGKTGNLTLTVQQADEEGNQTPLPDVGLTIYKVGSVNFDGNVHFVLDEALAAAAIDFDSITTADGWYEAAEKLAAMIVSGSVDVWGMSKSSDAEGNMTFADLAEGMYLVVQTDGNSSVMVSPMLISVPFADQEQGWMYDVQAYPKSVSNPQKHTQIQVTKRIYNVDENDNVIPLETKEDVTYKVGVFRIRKVRSRSVMIIYRISISRMLPVVQLHGRMFRMAPIMYLSWMRMEIFFSRIRRSRWMRRIFTTTM